MYTDVYTFIVLLHIQMFTHLLNCYVYICLHNNGISMYTDVYMFMLLLYKQMFTRLLYYYIVITDVYKFIVFRCSHVYYITTLCLQMLIS